MMKASELRRLQGQINDQRAMQAISDLAAEDEMTAAEQEQHCRIRKRAYEIWLEEGCPPQAGRQTRERAERELAGEAWRQRA
jgi:hypothetical protein